MLQALDLFGFKSFADKTRFEFPPGITVIVGPNGSGKSNVVDAIKWVLGAQSAKGLRGQEMADVIFKGSGSGNRPPMNTAEASLVFDNSDGRLPIDAPEVHVTRRVYRSGEGEYVINGNPCRLRDLKDLYSGTGLGSGAYSIIEQGKVDTLLQASAKDRRAIFEEAAGISRFKAKKLEAQRRLERVDQNLLRLSDIVEEVDGRLRSVRAQASKARRYREYTARLQELRTQVAQVDWRQLTTRLDAADEAARRLQAEAELADRQAREQEAAVQELETRSEQVTQSLAQVQSSIAQVRELNAVTQSTIAHGRRQCEDLLAEAGRHRLQAAVLISRVGDAQQQLQDTVIAFDRGEREYRELERRVTGLETDLGDLTEEARQWRDRMEASREEHVEQMRRAAALGSEILACRAQLEKASQAEVRSRERQEEISRHCHDQAKLCEALRAAEQELVEKTQAFRRQLAAKRQQLDRSRVDLAARQQESVELQGRRSGAAERASVIEELEERLEGVSAGVKDALKRSREEPEGPFGEIRGLVADALQVEVEHAGMVEVALGEAAHHLIVSGYRLLMYLQTGQARLPGRVGFVPLTVAVPRLSADQTDLAGRPGVIGRADQFVRCDAEFNLLVRRLVGRTWFVQTLAHAVALSQAEGRGLRFVTAAGELLEADGTLVVGHGARASGIISRRSELVSVRELVQQLDLQITAVRQQLDTQQQELVSQERDVERAAAQLEQQNAALAEHRVRTQNAEARQAELKDQMVVVRRELEDAENQHRAASEALAESQQQLGDVEARIGRAEQELQSETKTLKEAENRRQEQARSITQAQIERAKSEQRLRALRDAKVQCEQSRQERERAIAECREQLALCTARHQTTELEVLEAQSVLAKRYLQLESLDTQTRELAVDRTACQQQRSQAAAMAKRLRSGLHDIEQRQHEQELEAGQFRHERQSLADRLRDDYGIEISQLQQPVEEQQEQEQEREAVDEEIASLRRKISNIGAVNLEALEELEETEDRFGSLTAQYEDLQSAKASLERIIARINADSRRLFSETLQAVRDNFRSLFRKVFGGGTADIVLEDENDLLETGIDIVANPPGKQRLPISLLSGGERALTAVTLLLALFQFRPSPFCVLDEVDGPLDEANIGRFIDVLRGFLSWTRFVIVTHSKKTMTAATTLYGVTMQESGVSKRVSVRFEDVSDTGHISQSAIEREETDSAVEDDERGAA